MRNASRWAALFLAATALGVWSIPSRGETPATQPAADAQQGTGSITGTVMKDGKPVANARVGLIDASQMRGRHNKGGQNADAAAGDQKQKHERPTPTATTMTDADGKFALDDVKPGQYVVIANVKGEGRGRSRIALADGQTATVEVQLNLAAGGGKGGGKAGKLAKLK